MPDLNQLVANLRTALTLPSDIDEGTNGSRGRIIGTGDTFEYLTHPGVPEVTDGGNGSGTIRYPYVCRERHKHFVAQAETATTDNQINGFVDATYDFTFTGKVLIDHVVNNGKQGRSGNSIESHLHELNGANVG